MTPRIPGTICGYPRAVALPAEPHGVRIVPWADFARDNADLGDDLNRIALEIACFGRARIGGGAAPEILILRG